MIRAVPRGVSYELGRQGIPFRRRTNAPYREWSEASEASLAEQAGPNGVSGGPLAPLARCAVELRARYRALCQADEPIGNAPGRCSNGQHDVVRESCAVI